MSGSFRIRKTTYVNGTSDYSLEANYGGLVPRWTTIKVGIDLAPLLSLKKALEGKEILKQEIIE